MHNRSLNIPHKSVGEDESQERSQYGSRAEPFPSPWASRTNPDGFWLSPYSETFGSVGLEAFNGESEPRISNTNPSYGEADPSKAQNWDYDFEEVDCGDRGTVPGHNAFPLGPTDSQNNQDGISIDVSHAPLEALTRYASYQQLTEIPTKPFEEIGAQFAPGSPTDLERLINHLSFPIPSLVVSDTAIDDTGDGQERAVPEMYANTSSTRKRFHTKQKLGQSLHKSVASSGNSSQLPDLNRYLPNNYDIAMHDRQPPYSVAGGIEPQLGTLAAESVNAFYADADLTATNVAAMSNTDESFGVKRRRLTRTLSTLQALTKTPPGSEHWQSSSGNASSNSTSQNSLQAPVYPTSPSSSGGLTNCHQLGSPFSRDDPPSTPATISSVSLTDPRPLTSPSPSNLTDVADGISRCTVCHDKTFADASNLQRHMRDKHKGMKRLECLVRGCTVSFAPGRKDNRIKHVRAMHPDFPLPTPSTNRKRKAVSKLESG